MAYQMFRKRNIWRGKDDSWWRELRNISGFCWRNVQVEDLCEVTVESPNLYSKKSTLFKFRQRILQSSWRILQLLMPSRHSELPSYSELSLKVYTGIVIRHNNNLDSHFTSEWDRKSSCNSLSKVQVLSQLQYITKNTTDKNRWPRGVKFF